MTQIDDYIDDYAWRRYRLASERRPQSAGVLRPPQSVGLLRPNDLGLFDVIGNVSEWCYNPTNPCAPDCIGCTRLEVRATGHCELQLQAVRGGTFHHEPYAHSVRNWRGLDEAVQPWNVVRHAGFRVVKNEP
jgi:formylglycine-generating enzyme required for sulfatase activity